MEMRYKDLALVMGLNEPWYIKNLEWNHKSKEVSIFIDFKVGSKFNCPICNKIGCDVYDTEKKTWQHLNLFQYKTFIHARVPRTNCETCKVRLIKVPWEGKTRDLSNPLESFIMLLLREMPTNKVSQLVGLHDTKIWRLLDKSISVARANVDLSEVKSVGLDETSRKRGHNYISVFVDLDTSKVIHVTEGKDSGTVRAFKNEITDHNGNPDNLETFCIDMSKPFISGITNEFPNASITFDKFHVIKIINDAVDKVRKSERETNISLNKTRYLWLKNPENLTIKEKKKLGSLKNMHLKTANAYNIKLGLKQFWNFKNITWAEKYLKRWYYWATHSRLPPIIDAAKTIKRHWSGILEFINTRHNNGILEGINGIIQTMKRKARGFKNTTNFINLIYLKLGGLQID